MLILMTYKFYFRMVLRLVTSLSLGQRSSWSNSKKAQGTEMELIQHGYNDVGVVAGLCWRCFSFLCFLDPNFILKFGGYSCIYQFNRLSVIEFSFICDAFGVTPHFLRNFCSLLLELVISHFLLVSIITAFSLFQW